VNRFVGRRVVTVIVLICQLATAAHIPMAHAHTAGSASAPLGPCAHHAQQDAAPGAHPDGLSTDHRAHPGHAGSCCGGLCQCPCAQAAALAGEFPESRLASQLPVDVLFRVPDVPQLETVFFRPPI
jgi:hypothetical protein